MRDLDWQIIVTLHQTMSITKTAELLFLTQPALTKRIKAIEEELGTVLLVRGRKGSTFTPEGELIARKAQKVAASVQEAYDAASASVNGRQGTLRLGCPYSFLRYVLPEVMERYSGSYPEVRTDIHTMQSSDLVRFVEDGVLDVCFSRYMPEETPLESRLFSEDQACVICSHPFELAELAAMPYINYEKNAAMESALRTWWNERFLGEPDTRFRVTNSDICISLVQRGLGWGIVLDSRCLSHESGLYAKPIELTDGTRLTKKTWLMYRPDAMVSPLIRNFIASVAEENH